MILLFNITEPPTAPFQNFYKTELNKEEMYIRYIHKLYDLHFKAQNYTGTSAGETLRHRLCLTACGCYCAADGKHFSLGDK